MLPKINIVLEIINFIILVDVIVHLAFVTGKAFSDAPKRSNKQELFDNFTETATKQGYLSEEHEVVTEDGYILTLFRIVRGKKCIGKLRRPPVILAHGLLQSSDSWIDAGPDAGLAYLLADACFDVWAGDQRGNYYTRRHKYLSPQDPEFWDFSVDEIGLYDIPATIDYVLNATEEKQVNYVGFSQGSGTFFIMCSERPEYCDKVKLLIALAPSTRHIHTKSLVFSMVCLGPMYLEKDLKSGPREYFSTDTWLAQFIAMLCPNSTENVCNTIESVIDSHHPGSISNRSLSAILRHFPAGTSLKNLVRYGQAMTSYKFLKFNYGEENFKKYGRDYPPSYNLSAVTTPVVTLYGKSDHMVDPLDVLWAIRKLPNVLEVLEVSDPAWNHLDCVYSRNIRKMIFPTVYRYLNLYSYV